MAAAAATQGKTMTLSELRVFELKQELEKRGLDKSGIKLALVERLEGVSFRIAVVRKQPLIERFQSNRRRIY